MKEKIFSLLKTKYASLGLGDEILQAHAEMLASMGFVTEDNVESIVDGQKKFLEDLQKSNDKRATKAAETAKENAKKEFEEAQAKKEAEAKAAEERAKKEAEEKAAAEKAAKEAEEKAKKEAEEKAKKEEEERKKLEEMEKNKEIPQYVKDLQADYLKKLQEERQKAEEDRKAFKEMLEAMKNESATQSKTLTEKISELTELNKTQADTIKSMKEESDSLKVEKARKERQEKIYAKAKELGIPQWRIDEGLPISDDMDEDAIVNKLNVVATNIKVQGFKSNTGFQLNNGEHSEVSKEDVKAIASAMVKH